LRRTLVRHIFIQQAQANTLSSNNNSVHLQFSIKKYAWPHNKYYNILTGHKIDILKEICIFTMLKYLLFILILLFGLNFTSFAQIKPAFAGDAQAKLIKFYPSPATTDITFEYQHGYDKSFSLQLYNFMGKKVYELTTTSPHMTVSLSNFYRGVYIYQLRDRNGQILESGKFQIVK
jgi:hypothetical protein